MKKNNNVVSDDQQVHADEKKDDGPQGLNARALSAVRWRQHAHSSRTEALLNPI